jgi:hypothetical protein
LYSHGTAVKAQKFATTSIAKKEKGGYVGVSSGKRDRDSSAATSSSGKKAKKAAPKKEKKKKPVVPLKWHVSCGENGKTFLFFFIFF